MNSLISQEDSSNHDGPKEFLVSKVLDLARTKFEPRNSGLLEAAGSRGRQCVGHAAAVAGGASGDGHEASPVQDGVDPVRVGARHERLRIILEQEAAVCLELVFLITVI